MFVVRRRHGAEGHGHTEMNERGATDIRLLHRWSILCLADLTEQDIIAECHGSLLGRRDCAQADGHSAIQEDPYYIHGKDASN